MIAKLREEKAGEEWETTHDTDANVSLFVAGVRETHLLKPRRAQLVEDSWGQRVEI
jgi:hypothetical protein